MSQQGLSDEEFHRMQMQLIEMRTENYKLKDENKKNAIKLKELSERESKLDKELNKQIKMKKALSTLNKSKQAQEYEALLQQTEQEFALQNQTLMAELTKLSTAVSKLEKENQQMKQESGSSITNLDSESELRHLQAENKVLKNTIETMKMQHQEELTKQAHSLNQSASPQRILHPEQNSHSPCSVIDDPLQTDSLSPLGGSVLTDEKLLHAEAQLERLKKQLKELQDVKVEFETEREEKSLLEKALDEAQSRHSNEQKALESEVNAFREKLERKQAVCLGLQQEKDKLIEQLRAKSSEMDLLQKDFSIERQETEAQLKGEINSLGKALQSAHNLVERHQHNTTRLQSQIETLESQKVSIAAENDKVKEMLKASQEKERARENERREYSNQHRALEDRVKQLEAQRERAAMERDDAVTKFEENARASGALLKQVNDLELANEQLRRDVNETKELAEKRKQVMDRQAVESQELSAKFTEQITALKAEHEAVSKKVRDQNAEKIELLKSTCKKQEQELIRINHQDRAKTRELDSCQQQVRDMQATMTSLEESKGWFERALKDAEEAAANKDADCQKAIEQTKLEYGKEIERLTAELHAKDDVIADCDGKVTLANEEASKRDGTIESLKQQIQDEVNKQKLIEKKGHTSMKDLKRQLTSEKKRNEKLQEKLKEFSSNSSNLDELLHVTEDRDGDGSSTSSFSFRDLLSYKTIANDNASQASSAGHSSAKKSSPNMNKGETRELLARITNLQQEKWNLEEQVKHLEESAAAMAQELLEKTKLMQDYVQHTRTDHHKQRAPHEELAGSSKKFSDRMKSIITGQTDADVSNVRELNRKLTRMLEEEMMKNMALKENLSVLSEQLANSK